MYSRYTRSSRLLRVQLPLAIPIVPVIVYVWLKEPTLTAVLFTAWSIPVMLLDWIPNFPVTRDQLTMLAEGNAAEPGELEALIGRPARAFTVEALQYLDTRRAEAGVRHAS